MISAKQLRCLAAALSLSLAIIAGCATPDPSNESGRLPDGATEAVRAGYTAIVNRYLDPVNAETVGMQGISGLIALDSRLSITPDNDSLKLRISRRKVASLPLPRSGNVDEWAAATTSVWAAAIGFSPVIAGAPAETIYRAIFQGVTATLDPGSKFTSYADARSTRRRREGALGIGIGFKMDNGFPRITEVQDKGPAYRAGLRSGDVITAIDGDPASGLMPGQLADLLIDGPDGLVTLTVQRPRGAASRFVMRRSRTIPETVTVENTGGVLVARITHFNQATADSLAAQLQAARKQMRGRPRGLVLDLRGDPGGLLQQAVRVADLFLQSGPIVTTRGRNAEVEQRFSASGQDVIEGAPIIVLIDGETASASEILAAALQRRERALIVGSASYGKGTVQTVIPLPHAGELTLTTARVQPAALDWPALGIQPDVCLTGLNERTTVDQLTLVHQAWRMPGTGTERVCPPQRRDQQIDIDLARHMLLDGQLLARIRQQSVSPRGLAL